MQTVTVYTKPACVQCEMTKRWLATKNVEYQLDDIYEDLNLAAVQALGMAAAPVVIVSQGDGQDDIYWSGFRPDLLEAHVTPNTKN